MFFFAVSLLLSQEDEPQSHRTAREISREAGSIDHQFCRLFTKICVSSATIKGALNSMHALFSVCSSRDDNVITSKPTWKPKHANSILESSQYFCQISSKLIHVISSYTVSKLSRFFETQCTNNVEYISQTEVLRFCDIVCVCLSITYPAYHSFTQY